MEERENAGKSRLFGGRSRGEKKRETGHLSCLWTFSANGAREVFRKRETTHKENEQGRDAQFLPIVLESMRFYV